MSADTVVRYNVKETAQEIRKALRVKFPGVKFSLRMSRGTGYGWMSLSWVDGPTEEAARAVTDYFRSSYFDGMDDSTHQIAPKLWAVPGSDMPVEIDYSCNGVNGQRSHSADAVEWARHMVAANPGRWEYPNDYIDPSDPDGAAIRRLLWETDLTADAKPSAYSPRHAAV